MPDAAELLCSNCGAHLAVAPGDEVVACEYCGRPNPVPPELYRPQPRPQAPAPWRGGGDETSARMREAAAADAAAAAQVARAVTDVASQHITAGVSRAGSAVLSRLIGCAIAVVVLLVVAAASCAFVFMAS